MPKTKKPNSYTSVSFGVVGTTLYNERGSARGRGATASKLAAAGRLKKANDAFELERFFHFFHLHFAKRTPRIKASGTNTFSSPMPKSETS
jgi:hypothetical protein